MVDIILISFLVIALTVCILLCVIALLVANATSLSGNHARCGDNEPSKPRLPDGDNPYWGNWGKYWRSTMQKIASGFAPGNGGTDLSEKKRCCPYCLEPAPYYAVKCPHCGEWIWRPVWYAVSVIFAIITVIILWLIFTSDRQGLSAFIVIFLLLIPVFVGRDWRSALPFSGNFVRLIYVPNFLKILNLLTTLGVVVAIVFWFMEIDDRQQQERYQAWQVLSGVSTVGGGVSAVEALQTIYCGDLTFLSSVTGRIFDDCRRPSLRRIRLNGFSLERVNLDAVDLSYSELRDTTLSRARLTKAILVGSDLSRANWDNVDLTDAKLMGVIAQERIDLKYSILEKADLSTAKLRNPDLRGAKLRGSTWTSATLTNAILIETDFTDAQLNGADLEGARWGHTNMTNANLVGASLVGANLSTGVDLSMANLSRATLKDVLMTGANLTGAKLFGTDLSRTINLQDAILTSAQYDSTTLWPDGFEPSDFGAVFTNER